MQKLVMDISSQLMKRTFLTIRNGVLVWFLNDDVEAWHICELKMIFENIS